MSDEAIILTKEEWAATCMLAYFGARAMHEDTVGGLNKYGAFHIMTEQNMCNLSSRIDDGNILFDELKELELND